MAEAFRWASNLIEAIGGKNAVSELRRASIDALPVPNEDADTKAIIKTLAEWSSKISQTWTKQASMPFFGCVYMTDIAFTAATNKDIQHRIKNPLPIGGDWTVTWIVCRMRTGYARFQEVSQAGGQITMVSDATCTADILFFVRPKI